MYSFQKSSYLVSLSLKYNYLREDINNYNIFELNNKLKNLNFENFILKPALKVCFLSKSSIPNKINIIINKKETYYSLINSKIELNGLIDINDGDSSNIININSILINYDKEIYNIKINTDFNFNCIKDIKKFISVMNSNFSNYLSDQFDILNVSYELYFKYLNYPSLKIINLYTLKDIEKSISYEIIRHEDAIRNEIVLNSEIRIFKNNVTYFHDNLENDNANIKNEYTIGNKSIEYDIQNILLELSNLKLEPISDKINKLMELYSLSRESSKLLVSNDPILKFFESSIQKYTKDYTLKWIMIFIKELNYRSMNIKKDYFDYLSRVMLLEHNESLSHISCVLLFRNLIDGKYSNENLELKNQEIKKLDINIEREVEVYLENYKEVIDKFKRGNEKSLNFIIGNILKKTNGYGNPKEIREIIIKKIHNNY